MGWENDLDRWLTTPPELPEIIAAHCTTCDSELFHLDEVLRDSRTGEYFCDRKCFEKYLFKYINDEIEQFIDLLIKNKDVEFTTIEKG